MPTPQEQFDDALFEFSQGRFEESAAILQKLLSAEPENFDARLALGMAYYRLGEFSVAIEEGHKAEALRPKEQLVHTNLSLFYMKSGCKEKAEYHGLQARIAGWRGNMAAQPIDTQGDQDLQLARPKPPPPLQEADMPWRKKAAPKSPQ